jgi:hypothetical protein
MAVHPRLLARLAVAVLTAWAVTLSTSAYCQATTASASMTTQAVTLPVAGKGYVISNEFWARQKLPLLNGMGLPGPTGKTTADLAEYIASADHKYPAKWVAVRCCYGIRPLAYQFSEPIVSTLKNGDGTNHLKVLGIHRLKANKGIDGGSPELQAVAAVGTIQVAQADGLIVWPEDDFYDDPNAKAMAEAYVNRVRQEWGSDPALFFAYSPVTKMSTHPQDVHDVFVNAADALMPRVFWGAGRSPSTFKFKDFLDVFDANWSDTDWKPSSRKPFVPIVQAEVPFIRPNGPGSADRTRPNPNLSHMKTFANHVRNATAPGPKPSFSLCTGIAAFPFDFMTNLDHLLFDVQVRW